MHGRSDGSMVSIVLGIFGALGLGVLLTLVRDVTSPSNLAFAFVLLTILTAEFGGHLAAIVTAVVSAMSLNFFLTEPYLTLRIDKTDDWIAFVAMLLSGVVTAAFGLRRARWATAAARSRAHLDALHILARELDAGAPLPGILDRLRGTFPIGRLVVRDADERLLAASPADSMGPSSPSVHFGRLPHALAVVGPRFGARGLRLPSSGGRVSLASTPPLSLDVWEFDQEGLDVMDWVALSVTASLLGSIRPEHARQQTKR
jgi:hypothetical protein